MPNRLAHETSPYLLQHAHNPVDWYPWGPEALDRARAEDKPILLSVGYSACHWCHVMERESFEDPGIAALMNERFVCIKVDREERPDLDEVYMRAVQAFQEGQGGWPMTVFCTPEGKPYWGGTYFPPVRRGAMPGFPDILRRMSELYRDNRGQVERITEQVVEFLDRSSTLAPGEGALQPGWLERVAAAAQPSFDSRNGGFGGSPKFPPHATLAALLAHWRASGHPASLRMATETLDAMAKGGTYDLLEGGFARYSVDAEWRVPHFEKMLYDNAQLVPLYVDAWRITGRPHYARIARETLAWCDRVMSLPDGGFAASTDADSEGEEGRYFVWTPEQLDEVLGADAARVAELLQVTEEGTFEHGASVLRLERPLEDLDEGDRSLLQQALPKLLAKRSQRVAPGRDDKVITAWNALMVSAFARAGFAFHDPALVARAERAARFLTSHLVVNGRLQRTFKDGRAHLPAYADDHAALVGACLDLYEATFDPSWLEEANRWADCTVDLFAGEGGPLYYVGHDAEQLVTRSQHPIGGAEPGANGLAALAFVRLAHLSMRTDLGDRAELILAAYQPVMLRSPMALGLEAIAAHWHLEGGAEIGIVGPSKQAEPLVAELRRRYLPFAVRAVAAGPVSHPRLPWMHGRSVADGQPTAWVCVGYSCRLPTTEPEALATELDALVTPSEPVRTSDAVRVRAPDLPAEPDLWLNTDRPLTLSELKGQVVILDFWTYCCINCMHVLPELARVEEAFAGKPVVVIGVHAAKFPAERERENVEAAVARHRVRHPVVLDAEHELWSAYAIRSWPTLTLIDATGRVAWQMPGEASGDELIRLVDELLEEGRERGVLRDPVWRVGEAARPAGRLAFPGKVTVWPDAAMQEEGADPLGGGRLYVADTGHDRILECALSRGDDGWPAAKVLRTFGGEAGFADGADPRFRMPQGMARMGEVLYVADTENHALRTIDLTSGAVATVAGTGRRGGGGRIDPTRPLETDLRSPWDVAVAGTPEAPVVFVAMAGTHQIWVWLADRGELGPFAGTGREDHVDGPVGEAALAQPSGLLLYGRWLIFADSEISSVRAVDLQERKVVTIVGQGLFDFGDVDGTGADVRLQHPLDLTAIGTTLYVADTFNHKIKAISMEDASARTVVGGSPDVLREPGGVARLGEYLVVADTDNHRLRAVHVASGAIRDLPLG